MKYRIQEIRFTDTNVQYQIQEKFLWWWDRVVGLPTYFNTRKQAEEYLKKELEYSSIIGD